MKQQIQFIEYLNPDEEHVKGETMLKRGGAGMAGQKELKYCQAHLKLLERYKDKYLVFGNYTQLSSDDGSHRVACLRWDGNRWTLIWRWVEVGFVRSALLVKALK